MLTVSVFGSSTVQPEDPDYKAFIEIGRNLALKCVRIQTKGTGGIAEAVGRGAREVLGSEVIGFLLNDTEPTNPFLTDGHAASRLLKNALPEVCAAMQLGWLLTADALIFGPLDDESTYGECAYAINWNRLHGSAKRIVLFQPRVRPLTIFPPACLNSADPRRPARTVLSPEEAVAWTLGLETSVATIAQFDAHS